MQRTALVTGATAGFGAAICRTLIENGYRVIGTGRRVARLEQLQQELGENFHFLAFDISDRQATEDAFHSLPATWQSIDLLVNNARSEERRVGKECSEPCRSRWSPYH